MSLANDVGSDQHLPHCNQAPAAAGRPPSAQGPTPGPAPRSQKLRSSSPVAGLTTALVVLSAHSAAHASRGSMLTAAPAGAGSCSWGPSHDARASSTTPMTECIGWPVSSHQQQQQEQAAGQQQAAAAATAGSSWMDLPPWPLPALMPKLGASRLAQQSAAAAASGEEAATAAAGAFGRGDLEDLSPLSSTSACPLGFRPTPPPSSEVCSANSQLLALRRGRSISSCSSSGGMYERPAAVGCKRSWTAAGLESQGSGVYTSHLQHLQHGQLYAATSLEQQLSLPPLCKVARSSCLGSGQAAAGSVAFYSRHGHDSYYYPQQQQQQQQASLFSSRAYAHEAPLAGTEVGVLCTQTHQQQLQQQQQQQVERQYLRAARSGSVGPKCHHSSSDGASDCSGAWTLTAYQQHQQQQQQQHFDQVCGPAASRQQVLFTSSTLHNRAQLYAASASHPLVPVCDTISSTSSSGALLAAYYRSAASVVGSDVSSLSSSGGGMRSLGAGHHTYQQHHFQHQHQQQQRSPAAVVLLRAPSAAHEQMLLWAGRLLSVNCSSPFELTRSMWRRVEGRLDDVLLLSLGVTGSRTQAVLTVLLWLASKLEGRRRAVANASQLAQPLKLLPWAVNGLELHLLQLMDWSPYSTSSCSMLVA